MELYEAVSPLDFRYYGGSEAVMKKLLPYVSEAAYVKYQAKVEAALVRTLAKHDICSHEIADEVERASEEVTAAEVYEEQSRIRHNIRFACKCDSTEDFSSSTSVCSPVCHVRGHP